MIKWEILIATTTDRRSQFELLLQEFENQIKENNLQEEVGILYDEDNKQKSIGKKRQDLLELSTAEYINYFDSDDWPFPNYVAEIYYAILTGCDNVGMIIQMSTNGENLQTCCHSIKNYKWDVNKNGYNYVRNCTHFNPIKRKLAIRVGFTDIRFGEDKIYSDEVSKLCHTECFIETPLFHYRYNNTQPHNAKYGIQ